MAEIAGGTEEKYAYSIQQTTDGGYIVAGYSFSNDGDVTAPHGTPITGTHSVAADYWVIKLDDSGNIQWQKKLGVGDTGDDFINNIQQTADGGYIVAGGYNDDYDVPGYHWGGDYNLVKLDDSGNIQWRKFLWGTSYDEARSIQQTTDGGYIVAGYSSSSNGNVTGNHGNYDYWVVKLDGSGNIQWQKSLGVTMDDYAHGIQQTTDGGYIVAGFSASTDGDVTGNHGESDYWVVKLAPEALPVT